MKTLLRNSTTAQRTCRIGSRKRRENRNATVSEALNKIRSRVGEKNLSTSCSRDGCQVYLTDVPSNRVIVDIDKVFPDSADEQGDYVLFYMEDKHTLITAALELKSGDVDASKACTQLQQAATYAEALVKKDSNPKPVCHPILVHGGSLHPKQRKTLNRSKVRFLGRQLTIKTARCGRPRNLALALKK